MDKENIKTLLTKYRLVVPEIQREYVWGSNKSVLTQFIDDLNNKLEKGEANIGFLYSYKKGSEYYIIDGQQRYTTIVLLLYLLSVKDDKSYSEFIKYLRLDEPQPSFAYRVRSNTVSFMNSLFKSKSINAKDIKDQSWYRQVYSNDKTIEAMIGTLDLLNNNISKLTNITFINVLENVVFWYFNVDQTSQGEELYITMNSRGEKLTSSEQIKPRLFERINNQTDKKTFGKKWDDYEEFFYNPALREQRDITMVDKAMDNIIRIVLELKTQREHNEIKPIEDAQKVSLYDIEKYMNALKSLFEMNDSNYIDEIRRLYGDSDSDANFFVLKSLLTENIKEQDDSREYERVYHIMKNQVRRNKITEHKKLLEYLDSYKKSLDSFYSYILNHQEIITGQEWDKVKIYTQFGIEAEDELWKAQELYFWAGDIKALLKWSEIESVFSLEEFKLIHSKFQLFFEESETKDCAKSDFVRRALLCLQLEDYPIDGICFGYSSEEWKSLFLLNNKKIKEFISECRNDSNVEDYCNEYIKNVDPSQNWSEFVIEDYLLDYLDTKHIKINNECGKLLVESKWAHPISVKNMHLFHYLEKNCAILKDSDVWYMNKYYNIDSCVYIDDIQNNFAIDIRFYRDEPGERYNIRFFRRNVDKEETKEVFSELAKFMGFEFDDTTGWYVCDISFDDNLVVEYLNKISKYYTEKLQNG